MLLKDKVALITGGASGIGRAISLAMAREGATVLIADKNEDEGRETVRLISEEQHAAVFTPLDVRDPLQHHEVVRQTQSLFGRLDIACNNAGISVGRSGSYQPVAESSIDDWHDIISVNLTSVFYGLQAQIPTLVQNGGGSIVNTASIMGQVAGQRLAAYVASKHGLVGLTKCAALEYAKHKVRINAIAPGYVDTPMLRSKSQYERDELAAKHPLNRLAKPEEIAELVVWLASDRASFVTGGYYPIDGGYLAQ